MYVDRERLSRLWRLVKARLQDYSGLVTASTTEAVMDWVTHNGLLGFNGNGLRAKLVHGLVQAYSATHFVETGTYHAATAICARRLLGIPVLTCELELSNYVLSTTLTVWMKGVKVYRLHSPIFLRMLVQGDLADGRPQRPLFYLDAHEGRKPDSLPLLEELGYIFQLNSFIILIDDFQVPFHNDFAFGTYGSISLNLDLLRSLFIAGGITKAYFPSYSPVAETGYVSGYVVIWRSAHMDMLHQQGGFPLNLLRPYTLHKESPGHV